MNQHVRVAAILREESVPPPSPRFQVPFVEVGTYACKFIIGRSDEHAVCCGAPTDGRSWCAYHRTIVFDPSKPSRLR